MKKIDRKKWRLHWLGAILVVLTLLLIELRVLFEKGSFDREAIKMSHYVIGGFVFLLTSYRVYFNYQYPSAYTNQYIDLKRRKLMNFLHLTLLVYIATLAFAGGLGYLFDLKEITNLHKQFGSYLYYPLGIHVLLVLYHHFILKDEVLKRYL